MIEAEQKRIREIQFYREILLADNLSANYVLEDILYNILGFGCQIENEDQRIRTNVALELLAKLSIVTADQIQNGNLTKVMRLPLKKKKIGERFIEMIRYVPLPKSTQE